jgi:hypothetical protein
VLILIFLLLHFKQKSPHFSVFVDKLTRDLAVSLSVEEIKKISSSLSVLAAEKARTLKAMEKSSKKTKAVLKTEKGKGGLDTTNYDDGKYERSKVFYHIIILIIYFICFILNVVYDDDYDDFM